MSELVGYKLINKSTDEVVNRWGGVRGQVPGVPTFMHLPNGDTVHAPVLNTDYNGFELQEWYEDYSIPPATIPSPVIIPTISRRQFFQQAAISGMITKTEALTAVQDGPLPASLQAIIDGIQDEDEKFNASMILSGAVSFERNHPLVEQIGTVFNMTPEQIDQFFISAANL